MQFLIYRETFGPLLLPQKMVIEKKNIIVKAIDPSLYSEPKKNYFILNLIIILV